MEIKVKDGEGKVKGNALFPSPNVVVISTGCAKSEGCEGFLNLRALGKNM